MTGKPRKPAKRKKIVSHLERIKNYHEDEDKVESQTPSKVASKKTLVQSSIKMPLSHPAEPESPIAGRTRSNASPSGPTTSLPTELSSSNSYRDNPLI